MAQYWNQRLSATPTLSLPNVSAGQHQQPGRPGHRDRQRLQGRVHLHQDRPGRRGAVLRREQLRLPAQPRPARHPGQPVRGWATSPTRRTCCSTAGSPRQPNFNERRRQLVLGRAVADPGRLGRLPGETNDTAFVSQYFHDDADGPSQWGPSLYTLMHTDYLAQLSATTGYLKRSNDNDSGGTWLFDDETALAGLAAYKYIADADRQHRRGAVGRQRLHQPAERHQRRAGRQRAGQHLRLPAVRGQRAGHRATAATPPNDANWAGSNLWGQNVWDIILQGGQLSGILGDPSQTDNLLPDGPVPAAGQRPVPVVRRLHRLQRRAQHRLLLRRPVRQRLPGPADHQLRLADRHHHRRPERLVGGQRQCAPTRPTRGRAATPRRSSARSRTSGRWPARPRPCSSRWSPQGLDLDQNSDGTADYRDVLYVGRGVPDAWIKPGQAISVTNLTSSYNDRQRPPRHLRRRGSPPSAWPASASSAWRSAASCPAMTCRSSSRCSPTPACGASSAVTTTPPPTR